MTQPELKVELDELIKRAAEVEEFADKLVADFPADNPLPPCGVPFVLDGTRDLWAVIDSDRNCIKEAADNLRDLAESLINAAKAYEEFDESAAAAIDGETQVQEVVPDQADEGSATPTPASQSDVASLDEKWTGEQPWALRAAYQFYDGGDTGTGYSVFTDALKKYALWVNREILKTASTNTTGPFRGFAEWEGESATKIEEQLEKQRAWLQSFVEHCLDLAEKAYQVVEAYKLVDGGWRGSTGWDLRSGYTLGFADADRAVRKLKTFHEVNKHPYPSLVKYYATTLPYSHHANGIDGSTRQVADFSNKGLGKILKTFEDLANAAQAEFKDKANYDGFASIEESVTGGTGSGRAPKITYTIDPPKEDTDPTQEDDTTPPPDDTTLPDDTALPGGGLPTMPELPTDVPTDTTPVTDGVVGGVGAGSSKLPAGGLGMRAASVGGGGGGVPSMPLQPPVAAEGAGSAAGRGGPNLAGAGAGAVGAGAAMGGRGGMGMAPMAGQGGKGEDSKAKRAQQDEEALYAEDRPWTEAVIGNRRRKDGPDNKESK